MTFHCFETDPYRSYKNVWDQKCNIILKNFYGTLVQGETTHEVLDEKHIPSQITRDPIYIKRQIMFNFKENLQHFLAHGMFIIWIPYIISVYLC